MVYDGGVRVARHVDDRHRRAKGREPVRQLAAAHFGHHHVRQHEVDRPGVPLTDQQGLAAVPRLQDSVAVRPKDVAGKVPHRWLVFDQ